MGKINNDEMKISEYKVLLDYLYNKKNQTIKIDGRDKQFKESLKIIGELHYKLEITIILVNNDVLNVFKDNTILNVFLYVKSENTPISTNIQPQTPKNHIQNPIIDDNIDYTHYKILTCKINNEKYDGECLNPFVRYLCGLSEIEFKSNLCANDCIKHIKKLLINSALKLELELTYNPKKLIHVNVKPSNLYILINI